MTANNKHLEKGNLIAVCRDDTAPFDSRWRAARKSIELGLSERSIVSVRCVIAAYENNPDPTTARRIEQLKEQFERALAKRERKLEAERESRSGGLAPATPATHGTESLAVQGDIPGVDLLPSDADDFWDSARAGRSRREVLGTKLGMLPPITRSAIVAKFNPVRIEPGRNNPPYEEPWLVHIVTATSNRDCSKDDHGNPL